MGTIDGVGETSVGADVGGTGGATGEGTGGATGEATGEGPVGAVGARVGEGVLGACSVGLVTGDIADEIAVGQVKTVNSEDANAL